MISHLTRGVRFSASHRYYRPEWSQEENRRRFGDASLLEDHMHDYRCEVTVRGPIDAETGMVMDLAELDAILQEEVIERFNDHNINREVEAFGPGGAIPTTENLAAYLHTRVNERLPGGIELHRVRVYEDPDLWFDAYGPGGAAG